MFTHPPPRPLVSISPMVSFVNGLTAECCIDELYATKVDEGLLQPGDGLQLVVTVMGGGGG